MTHADALHAYVDGLLGEEPAAPATSTTARTAPAAAKLRPVPTIARPLNHDPIAPVEPAKPVSAVERKTGSDLTSLLATPPALPNAELSPAVRWLRFQLADQAYAVEVQKVQEVVRVPDIAPVAGAGADTLGVMNLRGQIVQVTSLRQRLSLGPLGSSHECRVVVLEEAGAVLGLMVDAVAEVFAAAADAVHEAGLVRGSLPTDWFKGLLRCGPDLVVALDASRLLGNR